MCNMSPLLPSPPRHPLPMIAKEYVMSTHIVPAAYPRLSPDVPIPISTDGERRTRATRDRDHLLEIEDRYANGEHQLPVSSYRLWNCVNRYVRKHLRGRGLTLFCVHANGFPKEIWEPTLQHLLTSSSAYRIDEVWCWESVQHGDAALLNANALGGICTYLIHL
jgi:hypothetical protein